jgi:hypothetical protein
MSALTRPGADAPLAFRGSSKEPWGDVDWQKLWLTMQGRPWSSIAVVPAGPGAPSDFTLTIAVTLARIGIMHLGHPIQVADATHIPLVHLMQFTEEIERIKREGDRVIVALASLAENPITQSIAQATDAALLCVLIEAMSTRDARKTVDKIGAQRFLGSVVFRPQGREAPKSGRK